MLTSVLSNVDVLMEIAGFCVRIYSSGVLLWPPCIVDADIIFSSCFFLPFLVFSLPNLSGRRLVVYHTSTHGVALVRIWNACLKCAARGSLKVQDAKIRHLCTITQLCRAVSSQLRHVSTIGKTRNLAIAEGLRDAGVPVEIW